MAKRRVEQRHPAIAMPPRPTKKGMGMHMMKADDESASRLAGWPGFEPDEKKVLLMLPWFHTIKAASDFVRPGEHHSGDWFYKRMHKNKLLAAATKLRQSDGAINVVREYAFDLAGGTFLRLQEMVEARGVPVDAKSQIEAIKQIHRIIGLDGGAGEAAAKAPSITNVIMFGPPQQKMAREGGQVIDVTRE